MRRALLLLAVMATGLAAVGTLDAAGRNAGARHYLDRQTGATITTMDRPLVFARERSSLAVNARDYISLVAIDVNRGGQHQLYWYGYLWTTIDDGGQLSAEAPTTDWLLLADARPIELRRVSTAPRDLGVADPPLAAPVRNATQLMFSADAEALAYLGVASSLALRCAGTDYTLWRDARENLKGFLGQLPN